MIWRRVQLENNAEKAETREVTEVQPHSQFPLLIVVQVLVGLNVWSSH